MNAQNMQQKITLIIVLLGALALVESGKCPKSKYNDLISPCVCYLNEYFVCNSTENFNLKRVFEYISPTVHWTKRKFKSLLIDGSEVTQLDEISFLDTSFEDIVLTNAKSLRKIHTHAFGGARMSLKKLVIDGANQLTSSSPDYNLFDALSSLNSIKTIYVNSVDIKEIPDYAFKPLLGGQWDLHNITIYGNIERIGNYAFYDYPYHLKRIALGNQINFIAGHAFDIRVMSFERVTIDLSNNQLTANSFESGVFMNSKRTLFVNLTNNRLTHLDEFIFQPFLTLDVMNQIDLKANLLSCDCRMKWLVDNRQKFEKQVLNALCSDERDLWSHSPEELTDCKISDNVIIN